MKPSIYLDYNATTPLRPEVIDVMARWHHVPANPSSVHSWGRKAKKALEDARAECANTISCFTNEFIFTASGTESNNQCLQAFPERDLLVSSTEHASVMASPSITATIPVDRHGIVQMEPLETLLKTHKAPIVSVMLANNETGVIQPIREIASLIHQHGGLLHCDAAQALGKIPIDVGLLGADLMSFCAHKMGGPVGAGGLYIRQGLEIPPLFRGGAQEAGRRPGTENIAAITGFSSALNLSNSDDWQPSLRKALNEMESRMQHAMPRIDILGKAADRLPNTSAVALPGIKAETQLMHFDLEGFAISAGSACSSGRIAASHVVEAMGRTGDAANCVIRISGGWNTTKQEIEAFTHCWLKLCKRASA